jgi:hypothetical protein
MASFLRAALLLIATAIPAISAPVPKEREKPKYPDTEDAVAADSREASGTSSNNLKMIVLAVHNYADVFNSKLPDDIRNKDGKALLSWRVQLLPYLEQDQIYKKFKLDQPWDSPDNLKLLELMPEIYQSPRVKVRKGYTVYQGFNGNGAVIGSGLGIAQIPDGTSNTIWCVEATAAVPWTKPADMPFDPKKDLPKFGKAFGEKPLAALCDGSVRYLDLKVLSAETLKNAIQTNDGMPLGADW